MIQKMSVQYIHTPELRATLSGEGNREAKVLGNQNGIKEEGEP